MMEESAFRNRQSTGLFGKYFVRPGDLQHLNQIEIIRTSKKDNNDK